MGQNRRGVVNHTGPYDVCVNYSQRYLRGLLFRDKTEVDVGSSLLVEGVSFSSYFSDILT